MQSSNPPRRRPVPDPLAAPGGTSLALTVGARGVWRLRAAAAGGAAAATLVLAPHLTPSQARPAVDGLRALLRAVAP